MIKNFLRFAACAAFALVASCAKNEELLPNPNPADAIRVEVTMQAAESPAEASKNTRVDYGMEGATMNFTWNSGDALSLIVAGAAGNENCRFVTTESKAMAKFTGSVVAWSETTDVYGIFPHNYTNYKITNGTTKLSLPMQQTHKVGASRANMFMVGSSSSEDQTALTMSFKQVVSFLKFNITGVPTAAKVVNVRVGAPQPLFATTATVDFATAALSGLGDMVTGLNSVVESATNGGSIEPCIAFLPVDLTDKELTFEVSLSNGAVYTFTKKMTKAFVRNVHYRISMDLSTLTPVTNVMRMTINTTNYATQNKFTLPISGTAPYTLTIDWGDGSSDAPASGFTNPTHTYKTAGIYQITITSSEKDASKQQMLPIVFGPLLDTGSTDYSARLVSSVDTPLLNMGVSVARIFDKCSYLMSISGGLFSRCTLATDFSQSFYSCNNLTAIPAELFEQNILAANFTECFFSCLKLVRIPATLFEKQTLATIFTRCFRSCQWLREIPAGLFDKNVNALDFSSCFEGCMRVESIPAGLFDNNPLVTTFSNCFSDGSILKTAPAGLFAKNLKVVNFSSCFAYCPLLKFDPNLFIDSVNTPLTRFVGLDALNFTSCFEGVGNTTNVAVGEGGEAPALWGYTYKGTAVVTSTTCFKNATKMSNAAAVPTTGWR